MSAPDTLLPPQAGRVSAPAHAPENRTRVAAARARIRVVATSGAHTPVVPTPSTINPLTALSCGRTFPDSAVMMASTCRWRSSHTDPLAWS